MTHREPLDAPREDPAQAGTTRRKRGRPLGSFSTVVTVRHSVMLTLTPDEWAEFLSYGPSASKALQAVLKEPHAACTSHQCLLRRDK